MFSYILPKAQKIVCREIVSTKRAKKYIKNKSNIFLNDDFSKDILDKYKDVKKDKIILINIGPKHFTKSNLNKIKSYIKKYPKHRKIFFPADVNYDKKYYPQLRKIIPNLEIYDRTKHSLSETIKLFGTCF